MTTASGQIARILSGRTDSRPLATTTSDTRIRASASERAAARDSTAPSRSSASRQETRIAVISRVLPFSRAAGRLTR